MLSSLLFSFIHLTRDVLFTFPSHYIKFLLSCILCTTQWDAWLAHSMKYLGNLVSETIIKGQECACVFVCLVFFFGGGGVKVGNSIHPQSESLTWLNWIGVWCDFWEQKGNGVTLSLLELPLLVRVAAKKHFCKRKHWRSHDSQTADHLIYFKHRLINYVCVSL